MVKSYLHHLEERVPWALWVAHLISREPWEQILKCLWGREIYLKPTAFALAWESQTCQPHTRFTNTIISISVCKYICIIMCIYIYLYVWIYAYIHIFTSCYYKKIPETGWFKRFISYRSEAGKLLAKKTISGEGLGTILLPGYSLVGCWKTRTPNPVSW